MNPSLLLLSMAVIMLVVVGAVMLKKDPMEHEKRDGDVDAESSGSAATADDPGWDAENR